MGTVVSQSTETEPVLLASCRNDLEKQSLSEVFKSSANTLYILLQATEPQTQSDLNSMDHVQLADLNYSIRLGTCMNGTKQNTPKKRQDEVGLREDN